MSGSQWRCFSPGGSGPDARRLHIYQGPLGFLKTAAVVLVVALLTVFSGSLFTAMVVHVILDVTSGRIMSAAIVAPVD